VAETCKWTLKKDMGYGYVMLGGWTDRLSYSWEDGLQAHPSRPILFFRFVNKLNDLKKIYIIKLHHFIVLKIKKLNHFIF